MVRIVHISDPHFGTEQPAVEAALAQQIAALHADGVVLSGDITQRARREQFRRAHDFLTQLSLPTLVVPGNHDIPLFDLLARCCWPYRNYRMQGNALAPHLCLGPVSVVGINSAPRWRHKDGEIPLGDLKRQLEQHAEQTQRKGSTPTVIVAVFHHPLDCRRRQDEPNLIHNAEAILATLSQYGVDLVLSGHIHDPLMRTSQHRYPSHQSPLVIALAGTCMSSRIRIGAPNSFNVIDFLGQHEAAEVRITRMDWQADQRHFFEKEIASFCRDAGGWQELLPHVHLRG
ncbi:DNA repair exonuclease [Pokkaliibacter plantistimulans]|uniref:DNA repair exonuclease n=1 Tax=Proteobacteria bacterium 228 TaxID=2083153 RepID=A0A2S5KQW3_9PROT|nr:metallophosphoesterase [Pokkaliibacter plantistimulans]PPC77120.1 DNA repair exonuclease [Pokkaliibacter plantistimulans]